MTLFISLLPRGLSFNGYAFTADFCNLFGLKLSTLLNVFNGILINFDPKICAFDEDYLFLNIFKWTDV